jgi:hypothetical protein
MNGMLGASGDYGAGVYVVSVIGGLVLGVVCAIIAGGRGEKAWIGFLLGFFFSCFGLVGVLLWTSDRRVQRQHGIPPPHPNSQWLADPTGRHQHRLWDGQAWSPHVSDNGRAGYDPL